MSHSTNHTRKLVYKARLNRAVYRPQRTRSRKADYSFIQGCLSLLIFLALIVAGTPVKSSLAQNSSETTEQNQESSATNETSDKSATSPEKPPMIENDSFTPEENEIFRLFTELMEEEEKNPDSARAKELSQQLDEAIARHQKKLESEPNNRLIRPPQMPAKEQTPPKPMAPISSKTDQQKEAAQPKRPARPPRTQAIDRLKELQKVRSMEKTTPMTEKTTADANQPTPPPTETTQEKAGQITEPNKQEPPVVTEPKVEPAGERTAEPTEAAPEEITSEVITPASAAEMAQHVTSPDDLVKIKTKDGVIDLNMLMEVVGKEYKFSFIYDKNLPLEASVKLQEYGDNIHRRDLLPLLESLLESINLVMIREDPFIRIARREEIPKKVQIPMVFGTAMPPISPGDSLVAQIVLVANMKPDEAMNFLKQFSDTVNTVAIPNTSRVIITEYTQRLPYLLQILSLIDQPGPARKLVPIKINYIRVEDAKSQLEQLMKALESERASLAAGTAAQDQRQTIDPTKRLPPRPIVKQPPQTEKTTGPTIYTDARLNRLLLIGTEEEVGQVQELLRLIDVPDPQREIHLEVLTPRHLAPAEAKDKISELISALSEQGVTPETSPTATAAKEEEPKAPAAKEEESKRPAPRLPAPAPTSKKKEANGAVIIVDEKTGRLIVVGTNEQIDQVKELLNIFDILPPGAEIKLEILQVEYLDVVTAQNQLSDLIQALNEQGTGTEQKSAAQPPATTPGRRLLRPQPQPQTATKATAKGPYMLADERTNRLLIVGTQDQIDQVIDLLNLLDLEHGPEIKLEVFQIKYVEPKVVLEQVEALIQALNTQATAGISIGGQPQPEAKTPPSTPKPERNAEPAQPAFTSTSTSTGKPESEGPYLLSDERTKRLLVVGSQEQIDQVNELLNLLDVPYGPEIKLEVFEIKYVEPQTVLEQVNDLIKALTEQESSNKGLSNLVVTPRRRPVSAEKTPAGQGPTATPTRETATTTGEEGPYLLADERTKRLLVVGSQEQIDQVAQLLKLLDVPYGPEIKLEVFQIKYVEAQAVLDQIGDLIKALNEPTTYTTISSARMTQPERASEAAKTEKSQTSRATARGEKSEKEGEEGPYLLADDRTNRLLVVGSQEQIDQVTQLLKLLDVEHGPKIRLEVFTVKNVPVVDIESQLEELIDVLNVPTPEYPSATTTNQTRVFPQPTEEPSSARRMEGRTSRPTGNRQERQGPFIVADDRTNRVLVVGTDEQIELARQILILLDITSSYQLVLKVYAPLYVDATEVVKILDELGITRKEELRPRQEARYGETGAPRVSRQTTTAPSPAPTTPSAAPSGEALVAPGLEEPQVLVAVHEATNRIFIYATETQQNEIAEIMKDIDVPPTEEMGAVQIYQLENQEAEFVAGKLKALMESERLSSDQKTTIPGIEGAPVIEPLEDIFAVGVRGSTKQQQEIKKIIEGIDRRMPQVLIEAILVQVSVDDALKLGITFQESYSVGGTNNDTRRTSFSMPFSMGTITQSPLTANNPRGVVFGTGGTLAFYNEDFVYATLEALQTQGNTRVISKPRVLVNSNKEAVIYSKREKPTTKTTIQLGSDVPIRDFAGYVDAGTELKILPNIGESREGKGDFLKLHIELSVNNFEGEGTETVPPPKSTNTVTTDVTVPDGAVIVLGGLNSTTDSITKNKIPLLGDIPLLGALFRSVNRTENQGVLYVFVKANIVNDPNFADLHELTDQNTQKLEDMEKEYNRQSIIPGIKEKPRENWQQTLDPREYPELRKRKSIK